MHPNPNMHYFHGHFYVSKCIVSNILLYVSNINVSNIQVRFPNAFSCFQTTMFPMYVYNMHAASDLRCILLIEQLTEQCEQFAFCEQRTVRTVDIVRTVRTTNSANSSYCANSPNSEQCEQFTMGEQCERRTVRTVRIMRTVRTVQIGRRVRTTNSANSSFFFKSSNTANSANRCEHCSVVPAGLS